MILIDMGAIEKKEKVAKIEEKQPKKPAPVTKKDLLNTEIDI